MYIAFLTNTTNTPQALIVVVISGSNWVNPEDPNVIAENELLGAAAAIEAAARKLAELKPKPRPKVKPLACVVIASELNIFAGFHHTLLTIVNVVLSQREKVSRREKMYSL